MATGERRWGVWVGALVVLAAGALLLRALWEAQALPTGPVPVPWDRAACARCRMLVSDPSFAAQVQLASGDVLYFDDPGDLLLHLDENEVETHAVWLHHVDEDRWIPRERVAFVERSPTPMGFGLGAVAKGAAEDTLSWEEALAHARAREAGRP